MSTHFTNAVARAFVTVSVFLSVAFPNPSAAQEPGIAAGVGADIATGLAVALLTGIGTAIVGEASAQVAVAAKTDGPHAALGEDFAFNEQSDACYPCWAEWDLDADTGNVKGTNHGKWEHFAWADLHYSWEGGSWKPKPRSGIGTAFRGGAYPQPDGAPDRGSKNVTAAAGVGAFGSKASGVVKEFKEVGEEVHEIPKSPIVSAEAQGSLYFSPGRFMFEQVSPNRVRVLPVNGPLFVDLFHTSFTLAPNPVLVFEPYAGVSPMIGELTAGLAQRIADAPGDLDVYDPDPGTQVDLTVVGAALSLGTGEYDLYSSGGDEKSPFDLLVEYFSDPSAVQVVAPTHAQVGYVPQVVFREVALGSNPIIAPGISAELRSTIPAARYGGTRPDGGEEPVQDLVGIVLGVQGALEDAVDLAARTPETEIAKIVESLQPEETFELDMTFSQSGSGFVEKYETAEAEEPSDGDDDEPTSLPAAYVGNWEGTGIQDNPPLDWTIEMSLGGGGVGDVVGNATYPTLGCTSELIFEGGEGVSVTLTERVVEGPCDDGTFTLHLVDTVISFSWAAADGSSTAVGSLTPAPADSIEPATPEAIAVRPRGHEWVRHEPGRQVRRDAV